MTKRCRYHHATAHDLDWQAADAVKVCHTFISCRGGLLFDQKGAAYAAGGAAELSMTDSSAVPPMVAVTNFRHPTATFKQH